MRQPDDEVQIIEGYVADAKAQVEQQAIIVEQLRRDGNPTGDAKALLSEYEESLAAHRAHLDIAREQVRLRSKLNPPTV